MSIQFFILGMLVPLLGTFVLVSWIHPLIVRMAKSRELVDNPDARKLQKDPVPVLGGIAVFWGIVVGAGITSLSFSSYAYFPTFVAITIMMYIGLADDMIGLSPHARLLIEVGIICFLIFMDRNYLNDFHGALGLHGLGRYVGIALSVVAGVGIINAINLIDGVDGLSSGFCIFAYSVFGYAFVTSGDGPMTALACLCVGSLIPFLLHNVFGKHSKMFIGDSGTLMMGTIMTIFVFHILSDKSRVAYNYTNMGVVAFTLSVLSVPVFDTLRVMTTRMLHGTSPFRPDKSHLHHLFIEMGFSHIGTTFSVISLNFFNVLCWLATYQLGGSATVQLLVVVLVGGLNTSGFYYVVRRLNHKHIFYRCFKHMAQLSHVETGPAFTAVRKFIDSH